MADISNLVKIAVDGYKGKVAKYSVADSQEVIRQGIIELNNGSTVMDYRAIRDGKCPGLFAFIETVLPQIVADGLEGNEIFNRLVEYKNVALGDQNIFDVENSDLFVVATAADGTQGIRRQRIGGVKSVPIETTLQAVRIYEEMNRVMAGRVDFNDMVNRVGLSFTRKLNDEVYNLWANITSKDLGNKFFPVAGSYDENALLDVISNVEAAADGKPATIIGTKKALRMMKLADAPDQAKDDLYNMGYAGKFYGTNVVALPQRYKVGTTDFALNDKSLMIIAGDDRPIKVVHEGDAIIIPGTPELNGDLTQEYFYAEKWGTGLVMATNTGIGRYDIT